MNESATKIETPVDVDTTSEKPKESEVLSTSVVGMACRYATEHGMAVFPCKSKQKTPATSHGHHDASKEPEEIAAMFQEEHNVAIRTGNESGVFVLDVDMPGGDESLAALEAEHGELPETVTVTTPRGGKHFYFRMPEGVEVKNSTSKVGDKLDIRGEGGYVVAAPSSTDVGSYAWVEGRGLGELETANAPDWLIERTTSESTRKAESAEAQSISVIGPSEDIPKGSRNAELTRCAGSMRRQGLSETAICAALQAENSSRCKPPLPHKEVQRIARSVSRYSPKSSAELGDAALPYRDFPVDAFPEPLAEFVSEGSDAIGCDASFIALPLLAGLASAIGNACRIALKASWTEPSILWTAIVGDSGTMKSPAIELALRPVRKRQNEAIAAHKFEMADFELELQRYEQSLAAWKRSRSVEGPPQRPQQPLATRTWADDLTVEALAILLLEQPRGLLVACDELASWFGGFDRYAQASGGDSARWLEMHGGRSMVVDRKTGEPKTICVPRASVSVTGGIQPGVLERSLGRHHRESGLAARLLLAHPPRKPKKWTETAFDPESERRITNIYSRLYSLSEAEESEMEPQTLTLSEAAKKAWIAFFDKHAEEQEELEGDLAAAYSKLEGYCARLALVLHLAAWADGKYPAPEPIRVDSIERARKLTEWFKYETRRIYGLLGVDEETRRDIRLIERVRSQGGKVTPRGLMRAGRDWPTSDIAEKALNGLAESGKGVWKTDPPGPQGGRPSPVFHLTENNPADRTPASTEV